MEKDNIELTQKDYFNMLAHQITHDVVKEVDVKIQRLDDRISKLEDKLSKMDSKIDDKVSKLDAKIDDRFGKLDDKISKVNSKFDRYYLGMLALVIVMPFIAKYIH